MGTHSHFRDGRGQKPLQRLMVVPPQAWRRYDTDRSGYIEANELKVGCGHRVGWAGSLPVGHPHWDIWAWGQRAKPSPSRASCRTC